MRLAIVGCGAVSELYHIPTASASDKVNITLLVDKNLERAKALARKFNIAETSSDYKEIIGKADAAILAVPHHLHAPMAIDLLNQSIHVLVEKPMALSSSECDAMIAAAKQGNATLAVGLVRRFLRSHQFARKVISESFLGEIKSFDVREGCVYDWPVASEFFFRKETGGGVLADTGAHTLDTILWWLGDCELLEYYDDSRGGVEADCEIHLRMKNGAEGVVELSRTRNLRNTAIIRGERATLEVQILGSQVSIQPKDEDAKIMGNAVSIQESGAGESQSVENLMKAQLEDWIEAIHNRRDPYVTAWEAARSVASIEKCYKNRRPLRVPWLSETLPKQNKGISLRGKKILIVGGTGFIGGRLVESLVTDHGADVRVLVRNFARAARIARFPIEMVSGDVTDPIAVEKAVHGCQIVFHCAYGNIGNASQQKKVTIQGTENVLKAALKHKVERVVHVSTVSVYGKLGDSDLDESAPRKRSNDVYADSKLEAEKLAFNYFTKYGLPVSVIQPTVVYGPFCTNWTVNPINELKRGSIILVDGGSGSCNAVYVDDVVQAMLLAAIRDEAVGEAFLVSGKEPVTWREFYGAYERMLGLKSTVSMTVSEIEQMNKSYRRRRGTIDQVTAALRSPYLWNRILQLPAVERPYRLAKVLVPAWCQKRLKDALLSNDTQKTRESTVSREEPILSLTSAEVDFFRARTCVRIDKAKKLLGYQPSFRFEKGMTLTEQWSRWANMLTV